MRRQGLQEQRQELLPGDLGVALEVGLEVRVGAWGRGQLQGGRVGVFQDPTDLKGRQDGEMVCKARAEVSQRLLLEKRKMLSCLQLKAHQLTHMVF